MTRSSFALVCCMVVVPALSPAQPVPIHLSLADAISRSLETSHRLAEMRAREQGARAEVEGAEVATRPIVSASGNYSRINHVDEFSVPQPGGPRLVVYPDIPDNFGTRLGVQWPIYTSGRTDALERAARAEAAAVGADIETARADLRFEVVRAYWAAATAREAVRVLEESGARADAQLKDAQQRFEVGLAPPNEVSSLEAQRSRERAHLIEAENLRESTLIELKRLIGVETDTIVELADSLDGSRGGMGSRGSRGSIGSKGEGAYELIKQALEARPERQALALRLGGAEARQAAASAGNKPTVAVGAGVDYASPNGRHFPRASEWRASWDASISVNWNVFDFGRTKAQMAEAAAAVTATRERLAEFDTVVSADVRQRLLDVDSTQAIMRAASDAVTSAIEARRVISDRYAAGVATSTDVLVAQVALLEAELMRTRALANGRLAEARLERALGR